MSKLGLLEQQFAKSFEPDSKMIFTFRTICRSKVPENSKNLRKKLEEQGIVNENDDLFCSDFIPTGFLSLSEGKICAYLNFTELIIHSERFIWISFTCFN